MRRTTLALLLAPLGFLTFAAATAAPKPANGPLLKLFDTTWQEDLADDPLSATSLGDTRYNDKLPDMTQVTIDARQKKNYARLQSLAKINREKLTKEDQLNYDLFERDIKNRIGEYQFKPWMFAVTTGSGPQQLAEVAEYAPFNTVKDYDNWIARINGSGVYIDQWIVLLTQGATEGLTQPRVIINKVLEQLKGPLTSDVEANPFYAPFRKFPASVPAAEQARLTGAAKTAISTVALPAFQRLDKFFREVYLPASRDTVGISNIPGGDQYYRNRINYFTTVSNMDAARIHNIGLEEVKRIRAEMEKTLEGINFIGNDKDPRSELDQFLSFIRYRPAFLLQDAGRTDGGIRKDAARHRAAAAEALRPPAQDAHRHPPHSRGHGADHDHGLLPAAGARRQPPGLLLRQPVQARVAADLGNRGTDRARSRARPSPADRAVIRADGAAAVPTQCGLHGLHRRLGAVQREAGLRPWPVQGRFPENGPAQLRDVARRAAGSRHGHALVQVDPRPGGLLFQAEHRQERPGHQQRDRPLHCLAWPGTGVQDRSAQDFSAARGSREITRRSLRRACLP
jgi:hypothetical protein